MTARICITCEFRKFQWDAAAFVAEWPETKAQAMRSAIRMVNEK